MWCTGVFAVGSLYCSGVLVCTQFFGVLLCRRTKFPFGSRSGHARRLPNAARKPNDRLSSSGIIRLGRSRTFHIATFGECKTQHANDSMYLLTPYGKFFFFVFGATRRMPLNDKTEFLKLIKNEIPCWIYRSWNQKSKKIFIHGVLQLVGLS